MHAPHACGSIHTSGVRMQVVTLFADLEEEIKTGQYINAVGQPQDAATLNSVPPNAVAGSSSAPLTSGALTSRSTSSYPSQAFVRHMFAPGAQSDAATSSAGAAQPAPPTHAPDAYGMPSARASRVQSPLPPRPPNPASPRKARSNSGVVTTYKTASGPAGSSCTRPRLGRKPLARPHRAAVRAVISMPCDPIPEDKRSDFPMLPPFVSAQSLSPLSHVSDGGEASPATAEPEGSPMEAPVTWATSSAFDETPSSDSSGPDSTGGQAQWAGTFPTSTASSSAVPTAASPQPAPAPAHESQGTVVTNGGAASHGTAPGPAAALLAEVEDPLMLMPTSETDERAASALLRDS